MERQAATGYGREAWVKKTSRRTSRRLSYQRSVSSRLAKASGATIHLHRTQHLAEFPRARFVYFNNACLWGFNPRLVPPGRFV
jgi:hypothetical protein